MNDKRGLLDRPVEDVALTRPKQKRRLLSGMRLGLVILVCLCMTAGLDDWLVRRERHDRLQLVSGSTSDLCPQVGPWQPREGQSLPETPAPSELAKLLSGAVQVNTSTYDDYPLPVSSDPNLWSAIFSPFRDYLYKAFPEVHFAAKVISLEHVNEHGLLYTWQGSNKDLKPIIFMAHQDVVPVDPDTLHLWEHGAFSGHIDHDKGLVYGRGASDDKASLVMLLTAVTSLVKSGFKPERTIVLSFGFDEETSGTQGALALAKRLEEIYGSHKDGKGALMVVDEGNGVDANVYGMAVAGPAVAEKGYLDVRITVHTPGGHSSVPPRHTSIGILSKIVTRIEDDVWNVTLGIREQTGKEDSPGLKSLLCLRDAPDMRHTPLGKAVNRFAAARAAFHRFTDAPTCKLNVLSRLIRGHKRKGALKKLERARSALQQAVAVSEQKNDFVTTQAVDLISGGVKINALPEQASIVINHRINVEQNVSTVRARLHQLVSNLAYEHHFGVKAWQSKDDFVRTVGSDERQRTHYIELSDSFESALEPAPRTPTEGKDAAPFRLLSSVIRHTYAPVKGGALEHAHASSMDDAPHLRVVPTLMGGNTDTKSYWNLTPHIFRFAPNSLQPMPKGQDDGIHTINEVVQIDSLTVGFEFYTAMMMAAQETDFA